MRDRSARRAPLLIRLHALAGRRAEALRAYERLCNLLEPSVETQRLYEEIRANRAEEPELSVELWERVGDLRVVSGDTAGAAKAFAAALETRDTARLRLKVAGAGLMQHDTERAEPHLAAAKRLTPDGAERARLACLRAQHARPVASPR